LRIQASAWVDQRRIALEGGGLRFKDPSIVLLKDAAVHVHSVLSRSMKHAPFRSVVLGALLFTLSSFSAGPGREPAARVDVSCPRSSAFVNISVVSVERIGKVRFEITDATGRTIYREEGKALTGELVRRLDKGGFPKGQHTLEVRAKDFTISRTFTVE
jgi:hypothetical protein